MPVQKAALRLFRKPRLGLEPERAPRLYVPHSLEEPPWREREGCQVLTARVPGLAQAFGERRLRFQGSNAYEKAV